MSRPGLVGDAPAQYRWLREQGVSVLLNLEERMFYRAAPAQEAGLEVHCFPINDMAAPSFSQAVDICRLLEPLINQNRGVVVHCRGGLGRTGTVIASLLCWYGEAAEDAVRIVRSHQPKAIQSQSQIVFLSDFAERIRGWRRSPAPQQLSNQEIKQCP